MYASVVDVPTDQILVPETWRYQDGRRLPKSEWEALRARSIAFVREGATAALVTSYLLQAETVTEQLATLEWLSGLRPDNGIYQDHIAHLAGRFSEAAKEQMKVEGDELVRQSMLWSPVPLEEVELRPVETQPSTLGNSHVAQEQPADRRSEPATEKTRLAKWALLGPAIGLIGIAVAVVTVLQRRRRAQRLN